VFNKSTNKGTVSDTSGYFTIKADSGSVIEISFIGYLSQQFIVSNSRVMNITLSDTTSNLDEVIAIGYGTARRKDLTGAIGSVSDKDFNQGSFPSPDMLIQGKVSGVQIMTDNGNPGGSISVKIRGNSALTGTGQPLYVIDGVQLDGRTLQDGDNVLNFLNGDDIKSIDVLKDASATAIYGSRAAYGVVIINTKKGRTGATKLEVDISAGNSTILRKIPVLNSTEYRQAIKYYNVFYGYDKAADVDGMDAILQTGHQQNYYIAGSGGNDNGNYRFSLGYYNMDGIVINSDFKKYTGDISATIKFLNSKRLGIDFGLNASQYMKNGSDLAVGNGNLIQDALSWNPTAPLKNPDGSLLLVPDGGVNPIAYSNYVKDYLKVTTIIGSISPYYKFSDWLEYKLLVSVNYGSGISRSSIDQALAAYPFLPPNGIASIGENELTTVQVTNTLTFNRDIAKGLHLNAVAGYEYLKFTNQGFNLSGNGPTGIGFGNYGLNYTNYVQFSDPTTRSISSFVDPLSELQSYFARTIFDYRSKYLLTATFRADGSTKFGANNKYGYFPSFAIAWNINKEDFFNIDQINQLKIRGSWGKTGNQEFPPGSAQALYAFQNNGSVTQVNSPNPNLKWQSDVQFDLGIDFSIFNSRVSGTVDYFNKNTTNLLFPSPPIQPAPPGSTVTWKNLPGHIQNTGIEILLNGDIIRSKKFSWNLSANVTFLHNNVYDLPAPIPTTFLSGPIATIQNGLPMEAFYTRKFLGLDPKTGLSEYKDSGNTLYYVGNPNPKILLGISTTFKFEKFSLIANLVGSYGQDIFNNTLMTILNVTGIQGGNIAKSVYQNPIKESLANPVTPSSRPIEKGDYLKMSNLTLSYDIGDIARTFKGAKLYVTAQNLFIITSYSGFDPEVNVDANVGTTAVPHLGLDFARYPASRGFILGINFSL
jgi:iron complex outermembrane receptor protein